MSDNQHLIDHLINTGALHTTALIHAFKQCDRRVFVPENLEAFAYDDHALPIGEGQTISQPYTVAIMLELLQPQKGEHILDIGSGSGWTTALLATIVGKEGFVEGVERILFLIEYSRQKLHKAHITNCSIELADDASLGKPGCLYDRILVSASASKLPTELLSQLNYGGILVIPIENSIWRITKHKDGTIETYELPGFAFVPLIEPSSHRV